MDLDHSILLPVVCGALVAAAKFRRDAPRWPELPLHENDIEEMVNDDCIRCSVVGHFGSSLRYESWNPQHPGFSSFVGGLLSDRQAPAHIRNNPELLANFPPARLKGMTAGSLIWRSPETLTQYRRMKRMIREHEAAQMGA